MRADTSVENKYKRLKSEHTISSWMTKKNEHKISLDMFKIFITSTYMNSKSFVLNIYVNKLHQTIIYGFFFKKSVSSALYNFMKMSFQNLSFKSDLNSTWEHKEKKARARLKCITVSSIYILKLLRGLSKNSTSCPARQQCMYGVRYLWQIKLMFWKSITDSIGLCSEVHPHTSVSIILFSVQFTHTCTK